MTLSITFYDDIKYHRMDFINRDLDFIGNGVVNLTDFPITYPSPASMNLSLGQGIAWVDGYRIPNDTNLVTVTVPAADPTYPRIDIIQIGHDDINQTYSLVVKKGVAATSPIEPGADPKYVKLYAINVAANSTSITSANVIDRRVLVPLKVSGTQITFNGAASTGTNTFTGNQTAPEFIATSTTVPLQLPNLTSLPVTVGPLGTVCIVNNKWYVSDGSQWEPTTPMASNTNLGAVKGSYALEGVNVASDGTMTVPQILENTRELSHLLAYADIDGRALGNSGKFYDLMDGHAYTYNAGKIDTTKTTTTQAYSIGAYVVAVNSITGFSIGQEVTIFDDTNLERPIISAIDTTNKTLTFTSATTKTYKSGATVCRSSVVIDTVNKLMKFGGWSTTTTVSITTPTTVVASAYDTSGNGGRKLIMLSDGTLIAGVMDNSGATKYIRLYKSTDNGNTWTAINAQNFGSNTINGFALASYNTKIYLASSYSTSTCQVYQIDVNGNLVGSAVNVDSGQSDMGAISLAIDSNGKLWAAWASKNSTYPNSFNIRVSSSTDGGTTWATPTQLIGSNSSGTDSTTPCIVIKNDNNPAVIWQYLSGTTYQLCCLSFNGSAWGTVTYPQPAITVYSQSNPSVVVDSVGTIHVAWHGTDGTDNTYNNIRYAKSADGGATWSTPTKLTSGNTYNQQFPSIATDNNNNIYVMWSGGSASYTAFNIREIIYNGTSWGSIIQVTTSSTYAMQYLSICANVTNFTDPLVIYQDNQAGAVKFRGSWSASSITPVLVEDVRYNITPSTGSTNEIVAWVDHESNAGFTVDGYSSIVASGTNESFQAMTKSTATLDTSHNEDQLTMPTVGSTKQGRVTLRLTLTRNATTLNKSLTKLLGAVE